MGARMVVTPLPEELLTLARSQRAQVRQLSVQLVDLLSAKTECYRRVAREYPDELRLVCEKQLDHALGSLVEYRDVELSGALKTGRAQARIGIALPDALRAYRLAGTFMYELFVSRGVFTPEQMLQASTTVWRIIDAYSEAVTTAYREVEGLDRSVLLDGVLEGRLADLEDASRVLALPAPAGLAVVVADDPEVTHVLGPRAIWRRKADVVAIVAVASGLAELRETLATARGVVGVSTLFTDLTEVPNALHRARIARRSLPRGSQGVVVFGDFPVAALAAGAPALAGELALQLLSGVLALPPVEREILLRTLDAWYAEGGSAKNAGKILYVHPNTVRYRIRRIEDLTGRDLDRPACVAELYLALQAVRLGL
jgi:DNA-binding PucR family transcriptional regulator